MSTIFFIALMLMVVLCPRHGICQNTSKPTNNTVINIGVFLQIGNSCDPMKLAINLAHSYIKNKTEFKHLTDKHELNLIIKYDYTLPHFLLKNAFTISTDEKQKPLAYIGPVNYRLVDYVAKTLISYSPPVVTLTNYIPKYESGTFVLSALPGPHQEFEALSAFMKRFNWKRAAVIHTTRKQHLTSYVDKILDSFQDPNHRIQLTGAIAIEVRKTTLNQGMDVLNTKLEKLKQKDTKIFIVVLESYETLILFCEVYHLKMYGGDIVWILSSSVGSFENWLSFNSTNYGQIVRCSREDLREAVNGAFFFEPQLIRPDSHRTASGLTADEFIKIIEKMKEKSNCTSNSGVEYSSAAFDALWAVSTALNNSIDSLEKFNLSQTNSKSSKIILRELEKIDFQGIGGPYSYNVSTSFSKVGIIRVLQYQEKRPRLTKVGEYNSKRKNLTFIKGTQSLWGSAGVPRDKSIVVTVLKDITRSLFIAIATLAALGILLGVLFLIFNLVYGKYKFIKLSAPLFNNIIACGCILCLLSVYLFGIRDPPDPEHTFPLLCKARAWTLTIGFSLAFGAMFVKTWRIYKICTNKKLSMKLGPLSNWYLLSLIGGIILVDVIILITWELVDPMNSKQIEISGRRQDPKVRYRYIIEVINVCHAEHMEVWLVVTFLYKGILILYGLFLAYETRNVIYAHLNDSRVIGMCVYNVVVLSIVGAFLSLLLQEESYEQMFIVLSVCIIFPAVATISLMMFPKIAYRCKTDNLDDTEAIASGMSTMRCYPPSQIGASMTGPEIHVTAPHTQNENTLQPEDTKDATFSYHKEVEAGSSENSATGENL